MVVGPPVVDGGAVDDDVGVLLADGGEGDVVDVGPLSQTGSPGSGPLPGAPFKNTTGTHTQYPTRTHAHQSLEWFSAEYVDPFDWHTDR
ncbi:MAG: hypothetical protein ACRDRI_19770 [Pseudonocardiaceae bacterium]